VTDINSVEPTSFARLDALARRGRRNGSNGDGPGFDALVAEATSRMMKGLSAGKVANHDTRPPGALGMAAQSTLQNPIPLPKLTEDDTEAPTVDAEQAVTPADDGTAVPGQVGSPENTDEIAKANGVSNETTKTAQTSGVAPAAEVDAAVAPTTQVDAVAAIDPSITEATVSVAGQIILHAALDQVGAAYHAGGTSPDTGFDDTGLVRYAYRTVGVEMPAGASSQTTMGVAIESIADALPGDLVSFGQPTDHVAIYAGNENIVHAPSTDEAVRVEEIERPVESIRRIVTPGTGPATQIEFTPGEMELQYQPLFDAAGNEWDVEPALLAAIAKTESNFNPVAVSPAGAQGLMQFMPATAREMNVDPWDPASAIDGAARYMRTSLNQFEDPELAIASYNAGRGAVSRYGGIPPFTETQNYVRKVVDAWRSRS
jgi:cell wall-associated NlpC family hydrolase